MAERKLKTEDKAKIVKKLSKLESEIKSLRDELEGKKPKPCRVLRGLVVKGVCEGEDGKALILGGIWSMDNVVLEEGETFGPFTVEKIDIIEPEPIITDIRKKRGRRKSKIKG